MKHLVVGATGFVGSEVCARLASRGKAVAALVRKTADPAKLEKLKQAGVELRFGDMKDKASLAKACEGIDIVISTASSTFSRQDGDSIETVDRDGQLSVVDAAAKHGVKQFVFVSFHRMEGDFTLQDAKRAVTNRILESGMAYTILEPTFFEEVWLSPAVGFDFGAGTARIYGDGNAKISWISLGDVAEFAVLAAERTEARNKVFELGGPEALSPNEVVKLFEGVSGKKFAVEYVPAAALAQQRDAATNSLEQAFAALMHSYAHGYQIDMKAALAAMPVKLTSVRDYAQKVLGK